MSKLIEFKRSVSENGHTITRYEYFVELPDGTLMHAKPFDNNPSEQEMRNFERYVKRAQSDPADGVKPQDWQPAKTFEVAMTDGSKQEVLVDPDFTCAMLPCHPALPQCFVIDGDTDTELDGWWQAVNPGQWGVKYRKLDDLTEYELVTGNIRLVRPVTNKEETT